ncbi:helix-turn-helix transcriptional regulator [Actinoallomurus sp. NPDC052308]|uniref:helix-turn-helix transcriptional regulator n=1 Tax=Actinoallomurus sp. NPDC052308 TaxID=3155530 RepID=UPI003449ADB5
MDEPLARGPAFASTPDPIDVLNRRDLARLLRLLKECGQATTMTALRETVLEGLARHFDYRTTTFFIGDTLTGVSTDKSPLALGRAIQMVPRYVEEFHRNDPFASFAHSARPASLDALHSRLRPEHRRYLERFLFPGGVRAKLVIPIRGTIKTGRIGLLAQEPGAFGPVDLARAELIGQYLAPLLDRQICPRTTALPTAGLTPRQMQIAQLTALGLRNDDIAAALYITRDTVKKHLTQVYAVTGCSNRAELAGCWERG